MLGNEYCKLFAKLSSTCLFYKWYSSEFFKEDNDKLKNRINQSTVLLINDIKVLSNSLRKF
jgi:hypothetical protein